MVQNVITRHSLLVDLGENILYRTGITTNVKTVETLNPPMIVHPMGAHSVPPRNVRGNKPPIVVAVVKIIGLNLVSPASFKAGMTSMPPRRNWFV